MLGMLTLLGIGDSNVAQQQREAGNSKANNEESSPSQSFTFLGGSKSEIELKSENRRKAAEKLKQYLRKANNNSASSAQYAARGNVRNRIFRN